MINTGWVPGFLQFGAMMRQRQMQQQREHEARIAELRREIEQPQESELARRNREIIGRLL